MALTDKLTAIADAIREKTGGTEKLSLDQMPAAVEGVYRAGNKAVWEGIQHSGQRKDYAYAFYSWDNKSFYPAYDLIPTDITRIFFGMTGQSWDLRQRLNDCGVTLDTSRCVSFSNAFNASRITCLPVIDTRSCPALVATFYACICHTIEKLIVAETTTFDSNVFRTSVLENLVVEGVIGSNVDFHYCTKLTRESLLSILSALQDFSGTDTTCVLTLGTENLEKLTDAQKASATEKGWTLA